MPPGKEEQTRIMATFIGQILVTAGLLNSLAAPLIKERYRFIRELSFRIVGSRITARVLGRRSLFRFTGFAAVRLTDFVFEPSFHRADLLLSLEVQPRFLEPIFVRLLGRELARRPGVDWSGNRLRLELAEMPCFIQLIEGAPWNNILSRIEITRCGQGAEGELLFNIYLHDRRGIDNEGGKGENKITGS